MSKKEEDRRTSISSLISSTLSVLGEEFVADEFSTAEENQVGSSVVGGISSRPRSSSAGVVDKLRGENTQVGGPSSGFSSMQQNKTRLYFNLKSSAGSVSSSEQATLNKLESPMDDVFSSGIGRQLKCQIYKTISEQASDSGEESATHPSSTSSAFIPRAPTVGEWGSSGRGNKDYVAISDMLMELDLHHAGERKYKEKRASSLQNDSMIGKDISWEEDAICNRHLWKMADSREACHLAESQYCQEIHQRRQKFRCSACKVMVHSSCIRQLYYEGYFCKETFREIKKKVKETVTYHHFMHRRKAGGKCQTCERGFGNWKKFTGREIVGISCSWCGDSYHTACFNDGLKREVCHLGPLRNLIIPPSWVIKLPQLDQSLSGVTFSGTKEAHISPKGSTRRKTRKSRKKKVEDKASKFFTVKPIAQRQHKPLVVFINPKSGGNQGAKIMQTFQWLLNPRQVFDLSLGGPEFGLKMYQGLNNFRILACGGDGTAGWILSVLDKLNIYPTPPMAILPLGTGNDLARVLNWGAGYTDEPIDKILMHVDEGSLEMMDRWLLTVWENPRVSGDFDGADDTPLHVINNYFSIGADAQVALEFHLEREANPEKFNRRYKNKFQYGVLGGKDLFLRRFHTLTDHITLHGDGEDLTERVRALRLEAICFLNIPSYGAGTNAWGNHSSREFKPQLMDDGKIEIVGFWSSTFPKLQVGLAHGERIAQCHHIKLVMDKSFPVQIDGEACKLRPSVIEVILKNKAVMIRKVARRYPGAPLQGVRPSERIKLSVSKVSSIQYDALYSDPHEIRRRAKDLGLVIATLQDTLKIVRQQIVKFVETDEDGEPMLSKDWRFLDMANRGRVDRMFQVTPDQEQSMLIGDMLSDGLLIVELLPSPVSTPLIQPSVLVSPEQDDDTFLGTTLECKRKTTFGRTSSYEKAVAPLLNSSVNNKDGLEVPMNPVILSADSSPSDTPTISEDESSLLAPFMKLDTGFDSCGTDDTKHHPTSGSQKGLLDYVKRGNLKKVRECHRKGENLTRTDNIDWMPLHHAARLDKKDIVQYIIENIPKEALDIVDKHKLQTALHTAASYGHMEVCRLLVEKGADLNRLDYQGNNVFDKSMQGGNKELQNYLQAKMSEIKAINSKNELAI